MDSLGSGARHTVTDLLRRLESASEAGLMQALRGSRPTGQAFRIWFNLTHTQR